MRSLMIVAKNTGLLDTLDDESRKNAEIFLSNDALFIHELTPELAAPLNQLWSQEKVKEAFNNYTAFSTNECINYFFDDIDRLASRDYIPNDTDILRARARTLGVHEITFSAGNTPFKMIDVGGQRTERRKWIHCFQDVRALIYCVAMSEYNLKLFEDARVNRMHESVAMFKELCNCAWFRETCTILFLNKRDLFEQKIQTVDLNVAFPEYTGGCNAEKATKFLEEKFKSLNECPKDIYTHITCATNTENVKFVFQSIRDMMIRATWAC